MGEKKLKALGTGLAKSLKTEVDLNQFSRTLTKLTVETALNAGWPHRTREECAQSRLQYPQWLLI